MFPSDSGWFVMTYQRTAAHRLGDHLFGSSAPFRIGVEEELFLVDRRSLGVAHRTDEVLARRSAKNAHGAIVGELCDGVIELTTPICANAGHAREVLARLRDAVADTTTSLMGVGVHPTAAFGEVRHRAGARYRTVSEQTRSLLRQSTFCGVHVHVGMPDPETAVAAFNGMRKWAPLLQALAANSPFWYGRDSGLASCRTVLFHSVPRTGMPRAFEDWSDVLQTLDELCAAAEVDDMGSVWWDMRLHAALGTLELRLFDGRYRASLVRGARGGVLPRCPRRPRRPRTVPWSHAPRAGSGRVRPGPRARLRPRTRVRRRARRSPAGARTGQRRGTPA
jgi:glutamate---cysteine ligase / carboxylate-amine ligase